MTSTQPGLRLRPMNRGDIHRVVGAHRETFPDGFFARLGPRFLSRYYGTFLFSPHATTLVAEVQGEMCAYLVGILDPVLHRRRVLAAHGRRLAFCAALALAARPRLALMFLRTRARRYARSLWLGAASTPTELPKVAVLSHVVVERAWRGQGVGYALVSEFLDRARSAGCASACLVTVAGVGGAGPFYEEAGWVGTGWRSAPDGRRLTHYTYPLPD